MSKIKLGGDTFGVTFHHWTTTSYSQSKSPILVKQTDWCYIWRSNEQIVTQIDIFLLPTLLRTYIQLGALVRFQNYANDLWWNFINIGQIISHFWSFSYIDFSSGSYIINNIVEVSMSGVKNRVALVTGAGSANGIGYFCLGVSDCEELVGVTHRGLWGWF